MCVYPIHAKEFSIQMLLYFCQIAPRVCTFVLFVIIVQVQLKIFFQNHMIVNIGLWMHLFTHMNNEIVRYKMHNLIRNYFRKQKGQNFDIQQQFSAHFQHHYSNLVVNMSGIILQAEPSSVEDYFRIESHN